MIAIQDAQTLWEHLHQLDIKISAEGERLKIDAPKGRISDELRALLTTHKAGLLQLHRDRQTATDHTNGYRPIPPMVRDARVEASFAQQRMWFLDRLEEASHAYTIPLFLQATGVLHLAALTQAVNEIIRRHAALRTIFQEPAGIERAPYQVVLPAAPLPIALVDLTACAPAERAAAIVRLTHETATQPFDLASGPLVRLNIVRSHAQEHLLLFALHHIVFDGLSLAIFLRELRSLYAAFALGQPSPLADLEIHYADFSGWQQAQLAGRALAADLRFWQTHLAGAPPLLELPTDRPRPAIQTFGGARQAFVFSPALTAQLRSISRAQSATLFMTLYAAFATLLARYTGQSDLVIGVPVANRNHPQLEPLIGLFVNTLALRCQVEQAAPFTDLLQQVKATALQAYRHQELPFERLINELNVARSLSYNPLFQVMFSFQDAHTAGFALPGLTVAPFPFTETVAKFDLTMILHEASDSLAGCIEYNTALFDRATVERLIGHFQVLVQGVANDPATAIAHLPLLTTAEEEQILLEFNATETPYPQDQCFHQLFEAQMARTPRAMAAVFGQEQITYDALNRRSNRWAWQLVEQGVQPGAIVALVAERSIDFLTALLAIWKAGAVYLPCDPTYPPERLTQIVQQSRAALVLTERAWLPLLHQTPAAPSACALLCLEDLAQGSACGAAQAHNLPLRCAPADLAYVIFTSGSTGVPKGAMVHHQGLLNHLYAMIRELKLTAADRVAQNAPQMFDISIWQFLVASLVGGTVHILEQAIASDPTQLLAALAEQALTILEVVPSLLRVMLEMIEQQALPVSHFNTLRWLIPTGEALPPALARQWLTTYPTIPLLNAYGPAECSDDVTCYPLVTPPAESVINMPIGRPVANLRVYILDACHQLLPIGLPGELYIGGAGVGLGYLHDAERTRQAFLPDPFAKTTGARLYKTGDLARWLPDGNLEYLGRVDFQVKIRGFRIELGEIEVVLTQHPAVQAAVLVARSGEAAEKQLVAYVTLALPLDDCATTLRAWLKARLPEYMLPATVVILEKLPLSPNGKIDRQALPDPATTLRKAGYVPPRDSIELRLLQRWEKLLGLAPISVQDNFFEVGGDSLLAIRLVSNIHQEFGIKLPLQTLFQSGTVEQLAGLLRQNAAPAPWSPLVCLQPQGTQAPFFCVHAAGGIVFRYLQVAALMGKERPFYGLQARGIEPGDTFYADIEAMAVDYVAAIRTVQPKGPYLLAGWSFGGTVAFAMARLLEQAGEAVPQLIMIDAPSPFVDSYAEDDVEFLLERLRPAAGLVLDKLELQNSRQAQLAYLFNEQRLAGLFAPDIDNAYAQHRLNLHKHHNQIICHYRPAGSINGRIIFFKPTEAIPFDTRMKEPTVDWARFALGGIEVHDAPGNHFSMFSPTHGPVLAQKMKACVENFGLAFEQTADYPAAALRTEVSAV